MGLFQTRPALERLHTSAKPRPSSDPNPFCTQSWVQSPSHHIFHWAGVSARREAKPGHVTQRGRARPLCSATALCFPRLLLQHMEKEERGGGSKHDDRKCHPPRGSCSRVTSSHPGRLVHNGGLQRWTGPSSAFQSRSKYCSIKQKTVQTVLGLECLSKIT